MQLFAPILGMTASDDLLRTVLVSRSRPCLEEEAAAAIRAYLLAATRIKILLLFGFSNQFA